MTHNLCRIPDDIYQSFFSAKVLVNRIPSDVYDKLTANYSDSYSSSDESEHSTFSCEYYLENKYNSKNFRDNSSDRSMITRSALKKLNEDLSTDWNMQSLVEPIPKIIIKKKSGKMRDKGDLVKVKPPVVIRDEKKPVKKPINTSKDRRNILQKGKRKQTVRTLKSKVRILQQNVTHTEYKENENAEKSPCTEISVKMCEQTSIEHTTPTAETGYSSAADSTTNEPLTKQVEEISKPILNYTLIPKPKRGRHGKTCCLDFVILPPTEPGTESELISVPIGKKRRGRPRNIRRTNNNLKVVAVEKKPRKKLVRKNNEATTKLPSPPPSPISTNVPVGPGKSLPIIEGPPNIPRAAWIKEQLMAQNFMCRIPLSKISRIPRVLKIQMPPIVKKSKPPQPEPNDNKNSDIVKVPTEDEPKSDKVEPILEIAATDVTKTAATIESINDWFPHDLDLSSLNQTNYEETDMVIENEYFPKNSSFTSTPRPNQPTEPIESYMTEKLATEALPDISFGSTLFNYTEAADSLVTPVKHPPPAPNIRISEVNDDRYLSNTVIDFETNVEPVDFSFKRPVTKQLFPIINSIIPKPSIDSPPSEPLDLSIRTGPSKTVICNEPVYPPSLSPQLTDDVLLLDASYQGIDDTRCDMSERTENYESPHELVQQRTTNDQMDNFPYDMDAMVREQAHFARSKINSVVPKSVQPNQVNQSQDEIRKSKIFMELNKITRTIQLNESQTSQDDHSRDVQHGAEIDKPNPLQYNGNLNFDESSLKHRVLKIFNFPCFRFLIGKCNTTVFPCKFNHNLFESRVLETMLASEPICVIDKAYEFITKYDMLFTKYFETFCILYGKGHMIRKLITMISHCERIDRPIEFFRHIITGLGLCNLDKVACYATLAKNVGYLTTRSTDMLIEIMLELEVVLHFTEKLEEYLKVPSYRINSDLFDRLLGVGGETKDPELIRIFLETINSYPSDCQKRLNSTILTTFLQMVRSLKSLQ